METFSGGSVCSLSRWKSLCHIQTSPLTGNDINFYLYCIYSLNLAQLSQSECSDAMAHVGAGGQGGLCFWRTAWMITHVAKS